MEHNVARGGSRSALDAALRLFSSFAYRQDDGAREPGHSRASPGQCALRERPRVRYQGRIFALEVRLTAPASIGPR